MEGLVRKKARKEEPSTSKNDGAMQSDENTLNYSTYLTYDILRIVFQYLDARNLASAAMVCRFWLEAANNEKRTRGCFIELCKTSQDLLNTIKNIRIKPSAAFFFLLESLQCDAEREEREREKHIEALLPHHCETIMLYSSGIIMENTEIEYPYTLYSHPSIVCAFLPQIPNVRIKTFKVTGRCMIPKTTEYQELIGTIVNRETSVSNHETSTCFMLFCNNMGHNMAKRLASVIQKRKENEVVSVWGGIVQDISAQCIDNDCLYKRRTKNKWVERIDKPFCVAVLITGAIQTWSMILEMQCNTKERVEAKLKLFKDQVKLKKHSIGFMFVCKARGTEMYNNETSVESTIFKRLFPKVPLAGCFGYGEFGKTTTTITTDELNEEKNCKEEHKHKRVKSWNNEFSTVFLILTYG